MVGKKEDEKDLKRLKQVLEKEFGLQVIFAKTIFQTNGSPFSGIPEERATELMKLYQNVDVKMIFDISGGDAANQVLPYLNFDIIKKSSQAFYRL